ncbi:hypothetical protein FisN_10Hh154 [Fistulifera solaris]|uniref:Uncharacterized protein n=1 Tax=Fistulifera solaris TaxID=1519565 RepID=A0A1Z5JXM4_FISSO|nr:hypothetical protein FisN_10Hh154 [Fistulifera solaris]|eukprot:GAX18636.1 hypothetical protein FisN_10Hh154 [Fistulifera solaris]
MRASITTKLTAPALVARSLSWCSARSSSASLLNMVIWKDTMELMLATCPQQGEAPQVLPPLRLESVKIGCEKRLKPSVSSHLHHLVQEHQVCGFVVHWPVQKEGWCGVPCGNVLRILDSLSEHPQLFSNSRPICLWDPHFRDRDEDRWGRSARYSQTPAYNFYRASPKQYQSPYQDAFEVWESFRREHWPRRPAAVSNVSWRDEAKPSATILQWNKVAKEKVARFQVCV